VISSSSGETGCTIIEEPAEETKEEHFMVDTSKVKPGNRAQTNTLLTEDTKPNDNLVTEPDEVANTGSD
jgi:hypothetical protein